MLRRVTRGINYPRWARSGPATPDNGAEKASAPRAAPIFAGSSAAVSDLRDQIRHGQAVDELRPRVVKATCAVA